MEGCQILHSWWVTHTLPHHSIVVHLAYVSLLLLSKITQSWKHFIISFINKWFITKMYYIFLTLFL